MKTIKNPGNRFPTIIYFLFLTIGNLSESRYLKNEKSSNTLISQNLDSTSSFSSISPEDDFDLENFVEDYYDDLWQYLEKAAPNPPSGKGDEGKEKWKNGKKENFNGEKLKFPDYDYMSDMAVEHGKKFKNSAKDPTVANEKEDLSYVSNGETTSGSTGSDVFDAGIPDAVRANRESNSDEEFTIRSKEMRLKSIISQVLSFRGGNPKANETIPDIKHYNALREIYEKNAKKIKTEDWTASYTEKVRSFYPTCDLPKNTDEDVWSDPYSMNLLFDLDYPNPQEDSTIMIVSAKLRLYKLAQENYSENADAASRVKSDKQNGGVLGVLPGDDDRQIRVSVYWYTRSLRRHRAKKKLLDSQMLSASRPKWAEFNIKAAVRTWKDSGKNFGLVVTVEDEDGTLQPADEYIQSMNCSKWTATVRPIPSIIMDKAHQYFVEDFIENKNGTAGGGEPEEEKRRIYPYQPLLYPIIDLRTREVPNSEVKNLALINSAKMALETKFLNFSRRGINLGNGSVAIFLRDHSNVDRSRSDKSFGRKLESGGKSVADSRVSYFQNVPIGSPSSNQNALIGTAWRKNRDGSGDSEGRKSKMDVSGLPEPDGNGEDSERELPRIRHSNNNRKQREMSQESAHSRRKNDFNAMMDHH